MTPQGDIMSFGFRNGSGNRFDYDLWSHDLGTADSSHNTFASDQGVVSFCNASIVMPSNGNILMPGGTKINSDNAGVADVPVYNPVTGGLSRAPDMANPPLVSNYSHSAQRRDTGSRWSRCCRRRN